MKRNSLNASRLSLFTAAGAALLGLGAQAQEQGAQPQDRPEAFVEEVTEATATVTAIDAEDRLLTVETEDGREMTMQAGDEVRNFDQIGVGDRVDVMFYEALAAEVTEAPASAAGEEPVIVGATRAPLGDRPAGAVGMVYTAVVTIDDVDTETNTVSFTGPNGHRELAVERPEMQEFIADLNAGDRVMVTYGEALAVAVNPAE